MQQFLVRGVDGSTICVDIDQISQSCGFLMASLEAKTGIPICQQRLVIEGKDYSPLDSLPSASAQGWMSAQLLLRVCGGKGGFGSNLRTMGARAALKQTTNFEACRDLEGRRLRTVHDEQKMAEWLANEEKRKKEKEERKRQKQESVLRGPLHKFDHHKLGAESREVSKEVEDAVSAALEKRKVEDDPKPRTAPAPKKLKLWDEDLVDSDEEDTEDEEDSSTSAKVDKGKTTAAEVDTSTDSDSTSNADKDDDNAVTTATQVSSTSSTDSSEEQTAPENKKAQEEKVDFPVVKLEKYKSGKALEALGLEHLKHALMTRGLKCGGNVQQRAERLFSVKGLTPDQYPAALKAKK